MVQGASGTVLHLIQVHTDSRPDVGQLAGCIGLHGSGMGAWKRRAEIRKEYSWSSSLREENVFYFI
jgi:hypothetical protein